MTGIQSSTGLITGIPIQDTVDKLMAVASQPKTMLTNRNKSLQSEKLAITQLSSLLVALQFEIEAVWRDESIRFDAASLRATRRRSPPSAASGKTPAVGNYLFTPVQTASSQQLLSQGFGADEAVGSGTISFGPAGSSIKGSRSTSSTRAAVCPAERFASPTAAAKLPSIDLSHARTVDDVLDGDQSKTDD